MDKYKINKLKFIIFISIFAICVVSNISHIAVYAIESKYGFIWSWASKSIVNVYQFYYIAFLLNCLICIVLLSVAISLSRFLQKNILKFFWLLIILIIILTIKALAGFIIFDLELYPFEPSGYIEQNNRLSKDHDTIYCRYWSFGVSDDYLHSGLCGRPN